MEFVLISALTFTANVLPMNTDTSGTTLSAYSEYVYVCDVGVTIPKPIADEFVKRQEAVYCQDCKCGGD